MWDDKMYELKDELLQACKALVNERLAKEDLSPEQEEELRQSMTEEIRFWRDW